MTGVNHTITGALVAVTINKPALALPAALLSHFVIDLIPHWHYRPKNSLQRLYMMMDLTLSLSILLVLSVTVSGSPRLIIAGGLLGMLPDLMWLPAFLHDKPPKQAGHELLYFLRRVHVKIQWSETGYGAYVEIVWFVLIMLLLYLR